jgi:hypothetical protein
MDAKLAAGNVEPCNFLRDFRFSWRRVVRTAKIIALMMEAVRTCETLVYFQITWRCIPE